MKTQTLLVSTVIASALLLTGCANKQMQEQESGFLHGYDDLEKHELFEGSKIQIMPGADFTKYNKIMVSPVKIISGIELENETPEQKKLFQQISTYLTNGYKTEIKKSGQYQLTGTASPDTMKFEAAISAVTVSHDDLTWYQFTPISFGITVAARATYVEKAVRILGEGRLVDSVNNTVLMRAVSLQEGDEVGTDDEQLLFEDVKPALDAWLKRSTRNFANMRSGELNYENNQ